MAYFSLAKLKASAEKCKKLEIKFFISTFES